MPEHTHSEQSVCVECGRDASNSGHPTPRLCHACWRRLVWRPRNGPAVELSRRQSRDAKRRRRAAGERI